MRSQLLCTFTHADRLTRCIDAIAAFYSSGVADMECYEYVHQPDSIVCIYSISPSSKRFRDTISINRKRETSTFYSINALNGLIRQLNSGILDRSYRINWHNYENSLLLADGDYGYKAIQISRLT